MPTTLQNQQGLIQPFPSRQPTISKPSKNTNWPVIAAPGFAFASFSDLHLGHRRNSTPKMIEALDKSIIRSGLLTHIKVLFLAGDVTDRLLSMNDDSVSQIDRWAVRLMRACRTAGVILRVMEGTPSHDRQQSKRFVDLYEMMDLQSDFRYVDKVEIEWIESLGINVLYIPDEAHGTTIETKAVVEALLQAKGLQKVDIAVMHGYFNHQLPYDTKEGSYHDLEFYESIVQYWITIGHVHTRTRVGKALAQGSHDRLSHGEEEDKGYVLASVRNPAGDDAWFINNEIAHIYRTIKCYDLTPEEALKKIDEECSKVPVDSRIRIEAEPEHPIFESMLMLTNRWPSLHITKHAKSKTDKTTAEKVLEDVLSKWTPVKIDKDNIVDLIAARLLKREITTDQQNRITSHLKECL